MQKNEAGKISRQTAAMRAAWLPSTARVGWQFPRSKVVEGYSRLRIWTPYVIMLLLFIVLIVALIALDPSNNQNASSSLPYLVVGALFALLIVGTLITLLLTVYVSPPLLVGLDTVGATVVSPWRWQKPISYLTLTRFTLHVDTRFITLAVWGIPQRPFAAFPLVERGRGLLDTTQLSALHDVVAAIPSSVVEPHSGRDPRRARGITTPGTDAAALLAQQRDWCAAGSPGCSPVEMFVASALGERQRPDRSPTA